MHIRLCSPVVTRCDCEITTYRPVAPPGGRGRKLPPYGWTSKKILCNTGYVCAFIVMKLLRITRQIHCKAVEQRATLIVHRQYSRDWGTSYSRPPIDPCLTSPLLQNPGGATELKYFSQPHSRACNHTRHMQSSQSAESVLWSYTGNQSKSK